MTCRLVRTLLFALPLLTAGCITVHHKVDPIHLTVDVNLRVQEKLDKFFDWQDEPVNDTTGLAAPTSEAQGAAS